MSVRNHTVLRSAVLLQVSRFVVSGLSMVSGIIVGQSLGASGLGVYGLLLAISVVIQAVSSFGLEDFALAWIPKSGYMEPRVITWTFIFLILRLVVCALSICVFVGIWFFSVSIFDGVSPLALGFAVAYSGFNGLATLGAVLLATQGRAITSAVLDAIWASLVVLAQLTLVVVGELTVESSIAAVAISEFLVAVAYVCLWIPGRADGGLRDVRSTFSKVWHSSVGSETLRASTRTLAQFWLNGLLNLGAGKNADVLVLGLCGAAAYELGNYNAAFSIYLLVGFLPMQGVGTVLYVQLGRIFGTSEPSAVAAAWRMTVLVSMLVLVPFLSFCVFFGSGIIDTLYGEGFASAGGPLLVLLICSYLARLGGGGSNQAILFLSNRASWVLVVRITLVLVNILLDVLLYFAWGIVGAAVATGVCGILISFSELIMSRRLFALRVPLVFFISYSTLSLVAGTIGWIAVLAVNLTGLVAAVVGGCIYLPAFVLLLVLLRPLNARDNECVVTNLPGASKLILPLSRR